MTEADREQWSALLKHYGALFGRVLPVEQAEAWYEELKPYHIVIISEAMQRALAVHKGAGWFPIAVLLEQCRELQREAVRAEENARKLADLRRATARGGDGLGFVTANAQEGEFTAEEVTLFAKATYVISKQQEGRDWLAQQVCCPKDGTGPKQLGGSWDWRRPFEPRNEPRERALCQILAQCLANGYNCASSGYIPDRAEQQAQTREFVQRINNYARKLLAGKRQEGEV